MLKIISGELKVVCPVSTREMRRAFPLVLAFCQVALAAALLHYGQKREDSLVSTATTQSVPEQQNEPGTAGVVWNGRPWGYIAPEKQVCLAINAPPTVLLLPMYAIAGDRADEIPPLLVRVIYLILIGVFWFWLGRRLLAPAGTRRSALIRRLAVISLVLVALGLFLMTQTYWGHSPVAHLGMCIWMVILGIWAGRYLLRSRGYAPLSNGL